ncbi:MAG TPA: circadian clock protein KaiC [Puia sp.]|nr:circadian clock protein KaiC [Puia sp.]
MPIKTTDRKRSEKPASLPKKLTGITGFDDISLGGLPAGRPTLVCGDAGCGKTLFSIEFIVRGAAQFNEPGVFVAFEEKSDELAANVASLGFDLKDLVRKKKIRVDYVHIERSEIEETGDYDLDGLFIRLEHAINSIGAKRVVLDTIESLFAGLRNETILRAELRRLFQWLKDKGVTAVITAEKGNGALTRQGMEEYVSDCVIILDHRITNQVSTRRIRIVKYRGSLHGTNEYPFLIDEDGISILPVTSLKLEAKVSSERVSSGIPTLDAMLEGKGFYKGSSVLVSGTAGTGKTSMSASFADATCKKNKRCLFFAFEESPQQIMRNMHSIGIDLDNHVKKGLLRFYASRPTLYGLEMHLVFIYKMIHEFKPDAVVLDPITNLITVGSLSEVKSILIRLIDFLQGLRITVMFTALGLNTITSDSTDETVSSLVDNWILIRDIEQNGERNKGLYVMKSRGIKHSTQVRELIISKNGLHLENVYLGPEGILTGSARESHMLQKETEAVLINHAQARKNKQITRKERDLEARISLLRAEFESVREDLNNADVEEKLKKQVEKENLDKMGRMRNSYQQSPKSTRGKINNNQG